MEEKHPGYVLLPSGERALAISTDLAPNEHTPEHLIAWIEKYGDRWPAAEIAFKRKLCTDRRMREFWEWLGAVKFSRLDKFRSSLTTSDVVRRATRLPGFPGNLTRLQRDAYFKKVRGHAGALLELLRGSKFDRQWMSEVSAAQLEEPLERALYSWGDDESDEGHTIAYQVTPEGRYEHHYDYPRNVLTETLGNVIEWTFWEDNWDGSWDGSSAPIAQTNSASTPIIYFCCTLHDWFRSKGAEIPFPVLASVANVALDLPEEKQVDEDTVRKQVRRYQDRLAKQRAERQDAFDGAPGQNFPDWDDSVLSEPY